MTNEYLLLSDEKKSEIEKYKPKDLISNIYCIKDTHLLIVSYSIKGENEESAKGLSDVHKFIMQYSPQTLTCESSEYFNKALYPLINKLERKLRKLVYLAASISDDDKARGSISKLEEKDFGTIFDLLFIDHKFINNLKMRVNADSKSEFSGMSNYTKSEINLYLNSLNEIPLWDTILSSEDAPTLRKKFREVQKYRNDIMHAHNIDKETYGKAAYLLNKINKELDASIEKITKNVEHVSNEKVIKREVNNAIASALDAMQEEKANMSAIDKIMEMEGALSAISARTDITGMLSSAGVLNNAISEAVTANLMGEKLGDMLKSIYTPISFSSDFSGIDALKKTVELNSIGKSLGSMIKASSFNLNFEELSKGLASLSEIEKNYSDELKKIYPAISELYKFSNEELLKGITAIGTVGKFIGTDLPNSSTTEKANGDEDKDEDEDKKE